MADIVLTKGGDGKLHGLVDSDERKWLRFKSAAADMDFGDTLRFSFKLPRSPGFHRRHFKILQTLFESQEQFVDFEKFREWIQVGAGFCDILPGPKGRPVAIPRSIAWDNLDDADFAEHHAAVIAFIRSPHFAQFLWPHVDASQRDASVESILEEFGS